MDSSLHGAPLSAIQMAPKVAAPSYNTVSGIRAPLTVDESDFEYSVSSKSRRNSAASSYYSGSELEYEGFVSGEDEVGTSSERHVDEEVLEETQFAKEYGFSKGYIVQERGNKEDENRFSRPFGETPGEGFGKRSGSFSGNAFLRPFVRISDERIYKGISNVNECDDSREFLSNSSDEDVENDDYVVNKGNSRPIVVVRDEGVSDNEGTSVVDIRFPLVKKLSVPIAQISRDSDDESRSSEALEEEGFSGIVRVLSTEVLRRVSSAPKVRISENDEEYDDESRDENAAEMEFVEDLVFSDGVLSCKDETEHIGAEGTMHSVVSADMIQDKGPNTNQEAREDSFVVNEEYNSVQNGDLLHLGEETPEIDVINDHREPTDLAEHIVYPGNISSVDFTAELECLCSVIQAMDDEDAKSTNARLEDNNRIKSENLRNESEQVVDQSVESSSSVAAYQCVDVEEMAVEGCSDFPESPESLTESTHVDTSDSILKDASSMSVSNATKSVFEDAEPDQEMEIESKNSVHLPVEAAEMEREWILIDRSQETDGQIVTYSDEGLNEDNGISDRKRIIDSAAQAPILNSVKDAGSIKLRSVDGIENCSLESDLADPSSTRPLVEARNPNLFVPPSTNGELKEVLNEGEKRKIEKIQHIRVKYLQLLHRLGHSLDDSVASKVLYELSVAEASSLSQTFDFNSARKAAIELETQAKGDLELSLSILVIGKTGVGKSATINSIFGEKKTVIDAFEPATTCVKEIIDTVDGFKVKVIDTPGLRTSPTDESVNRKVLSSIKKLMHKSRPDVVLYVDRLDMQTGNLNDLPLLRSVTSYLGSSIWQKSIIVLTHATSTPPDGPDGYPLSYEVFVAQKSRTIRQLISFSSGELLMNPSSTIPLSLVENHPFAETNECGESNGENWRLRLLFLCYSIKTLSKVTSLVKVQNLSNHWGPFGLMIHSPALSYSFSSLLQSKSGDSDVRLGYLSDSDKEDDIEYDNLRPFRSLTKSQIAKLGNDQQKTYFEGYEYCLNLLQTKQSREEIRRFKASRNAKTYMEGVPDHETILVPLPDMALPPSFDGENPSYRYRFLETSSHLHTRPVFDSHGWDRDCSHNGVVIEDKFSISSRLPAVISVQLTKDKKDFNIQLHSSISSKHGDNRSTLGLSIMRYRGDLICGCNLQFQFSVGRNSKVNVRAGVNNKLSGRICIKTSCSDQLQIAALAFLPLAQAIFKKIFPQSSKD